MAGVFDLELHEEDNIRDSDDDVIEVDEVSYPSIHPYLLFLASIYLPSKHIPQCPRYTEYQVSVFSSFGLIQGHCKTMQCLGSFGDGLEIRALIRVECCAYM